MVWLKPARSSLPPSATVKALADANALAAPACSVPPLTIVAPEYVLMPESVISPAFTWTAPDPEMLPAKVYELERLNARMPLLTTLPKMEAARSAIAELHRAGADRGAPCIQVVARQNE